MFIFATFSLCDLPNYIKALEEYESICPQHTLWAHVAAVSCFLMADRAYNLGAFWEIKRAIDANNMREVELVKTAVKAANERSCRFERPVLDELKSVEPYTNPYHQYKNKSGVSLGVSGWVVLIDPPTEPKTDHTEFLFANEDTGQRFSVTLFAASHEGDVASKNDIASTGLVDGNIPAHTVCPYRGDCEIAEYGQCTHNGKEHDVPFSCAAARSFEIAKKK